MDDIAQLEHLSLVNKVCTELENNCGFSDQTLGTTIFILN